MRKTRRGDTIIEVVIAITILAAIVIFTISMMKSGLGIAERSLELTTARNELNAQAEALRFIHSSYVAELNLPKCNENTSGDTRCQAFEAVWNEIYNLALEWNDERRIQLPVNNCEEEVYGNDGLGLALTRDHAFIINTRTLYASNAAGGVDTGSIIEATNATISQGRFRMPELNARLLFNNNPDKNDNPDTKLTDLSNYRNLASAEGIWVVGVKSEEKNGTVSKYLDFHIEACWNNAGSNTPSSLDTVIRLYNPAARN